MKHREKKTSGCFSFAYLAAPEHMSWKIKYFTPGKNNQAKINSEYEWAKRKLIVVVTGNCLTVKWRRWKEAQKKHTIISFSLSEMVRMFRNVNLHFRIRNEEKWVKIKICVVAHFHSLFTSHLFILQVFWSLAYACKCRVESPKYPPHAMVIFSFSFRFWQSCLLRYYPPSS